MLHFDWSRSMPITACGVALCRALCNFRKPRLNVGGTRTLRPSIRPRSMAA